MGTQTLAVEVPDELVVLLGSAETAAAKAREALVMELLRETRISQGRAAALLRIDRGTLLDLLARYEVASGPRSSAEWDDEMRIVEGLLRDREHPAGR